MDPQPASPLPQKVKPLAVALLEDIKRGVTLPETLSTEKKMLCVQFLIQQQEHTVVEMAHFMNVDRNTIYRYKKKLFEEDALFQLVLDESTIALEMIESANHSIAKLMKDRKYKDAWTVRRECIEMLQSLGYVKRVEQKLNIKGQINLLQILEVEKDLRDKAPDNGDEQEHADTNGNGHSGTYPEGSSCLE